MPVLNDYHEYEGRHYETGTIRNFWAHQKALAPHTGKPYSEALLMGVSGGAVMGYFTFTYEGTDPMIRILSRNTFDPMERLLERLGVIQNVRQTANPDMAVKNLIDVLEEGLPAIVWADRSLPYNAPEESEAWWGMLPLIVYGYDSKNDKAWIADRAAVPLTATINELAIARARVKKEKFRLMTLEAPVEGKLASAAQKGIWDSIKLFTEAPPKGARDNFGFAAYQRWADALVKPKMRLSWETEFPAGGKMLAGLTSTYECVMQWPVTPGADRDLYADFLDEASALLTKPDLKSAAARFRVSGKAWRELAYAALPDDVGPFKETRELMDRRQRVFIEQGGAGVDEMKACDTRLKAIRQGMAKDFPLDALGTIELRELLREHVLKIHDIERDAVAMMQQAMA